MRVTPGVRRGESDVVAAFTGPIDVAGAYSAPLAYCSTQYSYSTRFLICRLLAMMRMHSQLRLSDNEGRLEVKKAAEELQVGLQPSGGMSVYSAWRLHGSRLLALSRCSMLTSLCKAATVRLEEETFKLQDARQL